MSAGLQIGFGCLGLALAFLLIWVEVRVNRRNSRASFRLQANERQARANTYPSGNSDIYGTYKPSRRLPL